MRRSQAAWTIILIAAAAHLDLHLGRPGHMYRSFGWPWHWVTGLIVFALLGWSTGRRQEPSAWRSALVISFAALVLAQILDPLGEMVVYSKTWSEVMPAVRWRIFAEFVAAGACAGLAAFALARRHTFRRPTRKTPEGGDEPDPQRRSAGTAENVS